MTEQQFLDLCASAAQHLDIAAREALAQRGEVEIDGVAMGLFFDGDQAPDMIFCYVDIGPVARQQRGEIYEQLLTLNLLSGSKTTGVYAIDPASGNAIFIVHLYDPETLQGHVLVQALSAYAAQANALRQSLLMPVRQTAEAAHASTGTGTGSGATLIDLA